MKVNDNLLRQFSTVAVAVSGGIDSMALLHYCAQNASRLGIKVVAINIDHNIRKETSFQDSRFVFNWCQGHNIKCHHFFIESLPDGNGSEENAARIARYKIFHDVIEKGLADCVATAHHSADNAESVLMHLFRGSGLKGMCGISEKTENNIIRPLLNCSKEDIYRYVVNNQIPYVTDETNELNDYLRNYIRNVIIPQLEIRLPKVVEAINNFSKWAKSDEEYISSQVPKPKLIRDNEVFLPFEYFCLPQAVINRLIITAANMLGLTSDLESIHIEIIKSLVNMEAGCRVDIKRGLVAHRDYYGITLEQTDEILDDFEPLPFETKKYKLPDGILSFEKVDRIIDITDGLYFDSDKVPKTAVIRRRQEGDMFEKFGGGRVKLKKYLIDRKIPLRHRKRLYVIADGEEIYAIIGLSLSRKLKIDQNTQNIYKIIWEEHKTNGKNY